jgi:hypothetical protein
LNFTLRRSLLAFIAFYAIAASVFADQPGRPGAPRRRAGNTPVATDFKGLLKSLRASGARVRHEGNEVEQPFFSVAGKMISVGGADVQVFEYATAADAAREAAPVSPDGSSVGGSKPMWIGDPHFFRSGRLIVLYVGDDAKVLRTLTRVLGKQFAGRAPERPVQ